MSNVVRSSNNSDSPVVTPSRDHSATVHLATGKSITQNATNSATKTNAFVQNELIITDGSPTPSTSLSITHRRVSNASSSLSMEQRVQVALAHRDVEGLFTNSKVEELEEELLRSNNNDLIQEFRKALRADATYCKWVISSLRSNFNHALEPGIRGDIYRSDLRKDIKNLERISENFVSDFNTELSEWMTVASGVRAHSNFDIRLRNNFEKVVLTQNIIANLALPEECVQEHHRLFSVYLKTIINRAEELKNPQYLNVSWSSILQDKTFQTYSVDIDKYLLTKVSEVESRIDSIRKSADDSDTKLQQNDEYSSQLQALRQFASNNSEDPVRKKINTLLETCNTIQSEIYKSNPSKYF